MGVDAAVAKKEIIRLFFLGLPTQDIPPLWALAKEIALATEIILASAEYTYLSQMFAERRCPKASRLSYALASLEDTIITSLEEEISNSLPTSRVVYLICDGLVLRMRPREYPSSCRNFKSSERPILC